MAQRKAVEKRSRQANWKHRQRALGDCVRCGERCDINPRTQRHYHHCRGCRPIVAEEMKLVMARRRQAAA